MKQIAFFDFDGTITTKDTLLEFIKFSKGNTAFYKGFLFNSHWLLAFKAKLISNQAAKEKILAWFFKGMTEKDFVNVCQAFAKEKIPALIKASAQKAIDDFKKAGTEVVIVSASPENWLRYWTSENNLKLIATELEIIDGKLTGKIKGKNCHGEEKVNRIRNQFDLNSFDKIFAYGDSSGDKPMLALAHESFMKYFH